MIHIENLSKCYRIHGAEGDLRLRTLREEVNDIGRAPLRWLRQDRAPAKGRDLWALQDVSFTVSPGEVLGIIGPNGSGKSTLLKILSRVTRPTSGRVRYRGRVGSLLEVGTGFHPELTGRENIFLSGIILGMSRAEVERKFDDIVEFSEVGDFLEMPVKRYSSGMFVRLAFSIAAHFEPEILILDEVLAVGDEAFRSRCLAKMEEVVSRPGRSVLFVSHELQAVQRLCQRSVFLHHGKIAAIGSTSDVIRRYRSVSESGGDAPPLPTADQPHAVPAPVGLPMETQTAPPRQMPTYFYTFQE